MAIQEKADPFINLCDSIYQISIFIISKIMYVTPFGVFACIATVMHSNGVDTMLQLGQVLLALYITFYMRLLFMGEWSNCLENTVQYNSLKILHQQD